MKNIKIVFLNKENEITHTEIIKYPKNKKDIDLIEFHVKQYGITKSKNKNKNGKPIGLETRLIITPPKGAKKIINFEFQYEAINYIKENYGDITNLGKTFNIANNYSLYGKGYSWK